MCSATQVLLTVHQYIYILCFGNRSMQIAQDLDGQLACCHCRHNLAAYTSAKLMAFAWQCSQAPQTHCFNAKLALQARAVYTACSSCYVCSHCQRGFVLQIRAGQLRLGRGRPRSWGIPWAGQSCWSDIAVAASLFLWEWQGQASMYACLFLHYHIHACL